MAKWADFTIETNDDSLDKNKNVKSNGSKYLISAIKIILGYSKTSFWPVKKKIMFYILNIDKMTRPRYSVELMYRNHF